MCTFVCLSTIFVTVICLGVFHVRGSCIGTGCNEVAGTAERARNEILELVNETVTALRREEAAVAERINELTHRVAQQCQCVHYNCGCCAHLQEPDIHLNSTICANATYLSKDYGISLTVTVNDYCIYNETVSVRNPPPVCLGVPYVKEWAEVCVRLYDIDATTSRLHACVRVEARMKKVLIARYELGCFDLGPHVSDKYKYNVNVVGQEQFPSVIFV